MQNATDESPEYAVSSILLLLSLVHAHFLNSIYSLQCPFPKHRSPMFPVYATENVFISVQNSSHNYIKFEVLTTVTMHYFPVSVTMIGAVRLFKR
jgi:hypothetical protein